MYKKGDILKCTDYFKVNAGSISFEKGKIYKISEIENFLVLLDGRWLIASGHLDAKFIKLTEERKKKLIWIKLNLKTDQM